MRKRPKTKRLLRQRDWRNVCAWCGNPIPEDEEVVGLGAKARSGVDLQAHEGQFLEILFTQANRSVPAIVTPKDSPAKQEGYDLYFMGCSDRCSEALKNAAQQETDIEAIFRLN